MSSETLKNDTEFIPDQFWLARKKRNVNGFTK